MWRCRESWLVSSRASKASSAGSGPRLARGPSSPAASTHQPALRSWPCSRTKRAVSLLKTNRTTHPSGLVCLGGDSMSRRPAWERWTRRRRPEERAKHEVLAPAPDSFDLLALEALARRDHGLEPRKAEHLDLRRWRAADGSSRRSASACIWGSSGMATSRRPLSATASGSFPRTRPARTGADRPARSPRDELERHLAAGLVDHLSAEHRGTLALALGRLLVGVEDRPGPVELLLGRREHLVQDRDLVRVDRPFAVVAERVRPAAVLAEQSPAHGS